MKSIVCGYKVIFAVVLSLFIISCSSDNNSDDSGDTDSADENKSIEIFSWWTSPGEAQALQALVDVFTDDYPNVDVINVSAELGHGQDAKTVLNERMAANDPPDTFQLGPRDLQTWIEYDGDTSDNRLVSLDELFKSEGWDKDYPQAVLDVVSYNGHYYAVPVGMHRQNTLYYNTSLIKSSEIPATIEDLFILAEKLKSEGVTPFAISAGTGGWTLEIAFFSILAGSQGAQFHSDFYSGKLDMTDDANVAKLTAGLDDYLTFLTYTNDDAGDLGWDAAAKLVYDGEAAMYIHGDWATGYFTSLGWKPGVDFNAVPVTGSEDEFIYGVDAFALCKDAPDEQNAKNFLKAIGSPEAQAAFNIIKGSSPVNPNVDTSEWNSLAKATLEQLKNATVLHNVEINQFSVPGATAKDAATGIADQLLNLYTGDITKDEFISWIVDNYKAATSGE